jgi:polyhydroxyalkanoate synthesis regulator phasin
MPENDTWKRYLDAGVQFTQLTREKAEELVKELVKAGEVRRKETESTIEALLERSRKNTEDLVNIVRREVADQLRNLGLEDLVKRAGLSDTGRVADVAEKVDDAAADAAKKVAPAKKAPAPKKAPAARKVAAKKAVAESTQLVIPGAEPAKKAAKKLVVPGSAKKAAKKSPAKKAPGASKSTESGAES